MHEHFKEVGSLNEPHIIIEDPTDYISLNLDYENYKDDLFSFKFELVLPKNAKESIKILHGYGFKAPDKSIMNQPLENLATFFAVLIINSIEEVNKRITGGRLKMDQPLLVNAVRNCLITNQN